MITYFVMAFPFLLQLFNKIVNSFIHCHNRLLHSLMGDLCLALTRWLLCTKKKKKQAFYGYLESKALTRGEHTLFFPYVEQILDSFLFFIKVQSFSTTSLLI